jgi:hypothetical protein
LAVGQLSDRIGLDRGPATGWGGVAAKLACILLR